MKRISASFKKNGIQYKLLERTERVALFQLFGEYGGCIGYEIDRLIIKPERNVFGKIIESSESIPSNERFGKESLEFGSRHIVNFNEAMVYFRLLGDKISQPYKPLVL